MHPGRIVRLGEKVDANSAKIAAALVEMIVDQVAEERRKTYGCTAEQIVHKAECDSSSGVVVEHLLRTANQTEIRRLLIKVLPDRYFESLADEYYDAHALKRMRACYRKAFAAAEPHVKADVIRQLVSIIKEDNEHRVITMEDAFFHAADLEFATSTDVELVKDHLLSRMKEGLSSELIESLGGIGKFMLPCNVNQFTDALINPIVYKSRGSYLKESAENLFHGEASIASEDVRKEIIARCDDWIAMFLEKGSEEQSEKVKSLKEWIEVF